MNELKEEMDQIQKEVNENKVVLYMKGSKQLPQCGFSAQVAHILSVTGVDFLDRNVLQDDGLREAIKEFSNWPTIPQLYIDGKFVGGCDIVTQMYERKELQKLLGIDSE